MARTDKDRPYWVKKNDTTYTRKINHYHNVWRHKGECTFSNEPYKSAEDDRDRYCGWDLTGKDKWHWYDGGVPKWFIDDRYYNPERVRTRDTLREAVKEYNANGELDDFDYWNRQHRHNASYYYW